VGEKKRLFEEHRRDNHILDVVSLLYLLSMMQSFSKIYLSLFLITCVCKGYIPSVENIEFTHCPTMTSFSAINVEPIHMPGKLSKL
jgi:hypothetical protein